MFAPGAALVETLGGRGRGSPQLTPGPWPDYSTVLQVKGTALHFWSWGTEQPKLKCHAPEKLGQLAVSGKREVDSIAQRRCGVPGPEVEKAHGLIVPVGETDETPDHPRRTPGRSVPRLGPGDEGEVGGSP